MRFSFLLLALSSTLLETVLALTQAAPWEMLYFYSAYKSEWFSGRSGAERKIATLCKHKDRDAADAAKYSNEIKAAGIATGICTFDEFVKHVGETQAYQKYYHTPETTTINPPSDEGLADKFELAAKGQKKLAVVPSRLLRTTVFNALGKVPYESVVAAVTDAFQDARTTAVTKNVNVALVDAEVKISKACTQMVSQFRFGDAQKYTTEYVTKRLVGTPFTLAKFKATKLYMPNGIFLTSFDHVVEFDTMMQNAKATSKQKNELMRNVEKDLASDSAVKEHKNVLEGFNGATAKLSTDISACNVGKKREIFWIDDAGQDTGRDSAMSMGSFAILEFRDAGATWSSGNTNQRHLQGLNIVFKSFHMVATGL